MVAFLGINRKDSRSVFKGKDLKRLRLHLEQIAKEDFGNRILEVIQKTCFSPLNLALAAQIRQLSKKDV